jgi:protein kinase A
VVRSNPLPEDIARTYVCEAALALEELHRNKILYRDLKAANALLDAKGHLRLADFGLAKMADTSLSFLGSMNYLAP